MERPFNDIFNPNYSGVGKKETQYDEAFRRGISEKMSPDKDDTILKEWFVSIDSKDRNRVTEPNPSSYNVPFEPSDTYVGASLNRKYKNCVGIELIGATVPNVNNVLDEIYLLLEIGNISSDTYDATNTTVKNAFAKLSFLESSAKFLRMDTAVSVPLHVVYKTPINIDRFQIRIKKCDGTLFDFGTDNVPPMDFNPDIQNSFVFKITTREKDITQLNVRNV